MEQVCEMVLSMALSSPVGSRVSEVPVLLMVSLDCGLAECNCFFKFGAKKQTQACSMSEVCHCSWLEENTQINHLPFKF